MADWQQHGVRGLLERGNFDLRRQPVVQNKDGTTSTVDSVSFNFDGVEVLLPSVTPDGRHLKNDKDVIQEYIRTGRHLGKFTDRNTATRYAQYLHDLYESGFIRREAFVPGSEKTGVPFVPPPPLGLRQVVSGRSLMDLPKRGR